MHYRTALASGILSIAICLHASAQVAVVAKGLQTGDALVIQGASFDPQKTRLQFHGLQKEVAPSWISQDRTLLRVIIRQVPKVGR